MELSMTDLFLHGKGSLMSNTLTEAGFMSNIGPNNNLRDTALCKDYLGYGVNGTTEAVLSQSSDELVSAQDDGCRLVLGLGPTPTSYCSDHCPSVVRKSKESVSLFSQSWVSESDSGMLKLGLSRAEMDPVSTVSQGDGDLSPPQSYSPPGETSLLNLAVDEGSTSAKKSGGYMPSLLFAPRMESSSNGKAIAEIEHLFDIGSSHGHHPAQSDLQFSPEPSATTDGSIGGISDSMIVDAMVHQQNNKLHMKKCRFKGCTKGARGASGLCIAHGGGQRCQKPGCNKGAESRTAYCKAHGGGRRCQRLGCTKSAEGKTDFCIAHGGGHRCGHQGCSKAARGKSGLCIRHGGGKRCTVDGCTRSAEGQAGKCISHGGGRRCQHQGCSKGAQGSTMYCKAHGGGKRCIFEGCTKGAEGSTPLCKGHGGGKRCLFEGGGICPKSVHGGTDFCVAHGGGKRCAVTGCTKSARGRTDCCVKHGGGKRCHFEGCGKSAQGSTDFCKAHGGGKRCSWGAGCEKFARGKSGLCAAHGSMAALQQQLDGAKTSGMIGPGLFKGIVSTSTTVGGSMDNEYSSSGASAISDCAESSENIAKKQKQVRIPNQVLVPLSMKCPSSSSMGKEGGRSQDKNVAGIVIPEGRVHGGGLMSLLGGNLRNAVDGGLM